MTQLSNLQDVLYYLPDKSSCEKLADFFHIFADPSRLRLLSALSLSRLSVGDIAALLEMNQTTVSHQLRHLRDLGAVRYERDGKMLYYTLCNKIINEVMLLGVNHILDKRTN